METLLKMGLMQSSFPFFGVPAFFSFQKNIELLVQNWGFTPYWFLDLSGCLGGIPIVFSQICGDYGENSNINYIPKSHPITNPKTLWSKNQVLSFVKMTKNLPTNQKKNHSSHKYTTQKVPSLKLT